MRTLDLNSNWGAWKFGDTDAVMTFTPRTDGKAPDVTNKTLTFEIAKGNATTHSDYTASAPGEASDDGSTVSLHTSDLTELKPGTYSVELWITDNDTKKNSVYPSDGFCSFTVDENTMAVTDVSNIKTMTLEAVYSDLLQKINVFKSGKPGADGVTPKLQAGNITKLPSTAQPTFLLTPLPNDPNTYVLDLGLPQGVQGPQGASIKGPIGKTGNDGLTPSIGDNGNWFIGSTDTGVHAQGPKGDTPDVSDFITSSTLAQNVSVINAAIAKRVTQEDFNNLSVKVDNNVQNTTKNTGDIANLKTASDDHEKEIASLKETVKKQGEMIAKLQQPVSSSASGSEATNPSSSEAPNASTEADKPSSPLNNSTPQSPSNSPK